MRFMTAAALGGLVLGLAGAAFAQAPATPVAPAKIHVILPASATLSINGQKTTSTSGDRWFVTPPLDTTKSYSYKLKAEMVVDGATVVAERELHLQGGREASVTLEFTSPSAAATPAPAAPPAAPAPTAPRAKVDWPSSWTGN